MKVLKKLYFFISSDERKKLPLLVIMITIMALLEMIGVASIIPFITVLTNPTLVETNIFLNNMFKVSGVFGVETNHEFLFILGILVFFLLVTSISFKAFTVYILARFSYMLDYSISKFIIEKYLYQPYSWFLSRNSADLGKSILSEVGILTGNGIRPIMLMITQSMVIITLLSLLILVDVKIALSVFFILGTSYGLIYKLLRGYVHQIGEGRLETNRLRFTALSEAFGAVKEIKVGGLEKLNIKKFSEPSKKMAILHAAFSVVNQLPRFALEALTFGGMMLLILFMMKKTGTFVESLPIISLYALAGYRIMPALQQVYASMTQLRFLGPALDALYYDIKNLKPSEFKKDQSEIIFNKKIILNQINYSYPNSSRTALKDININIPAKTTVGIIGATGSGKTTVVDIILGLLETTNGTLEVDDKVIDKHNCGAWQKSIGYVPQQIYLADDTISANIAFGVNPENLDQNKLENVAKIANIHDFIINELPNQYHTTIGERGIRLSGGQRQRIGIARALYHKPKLLILDEATSALDNMTEQAVIEAINNLSKEITIILIAHRLSTVKICDKIFKIEKGQLVDQGTFDEIIK